MTIFIFVLIEILYEPHFTFSCITLVCIVLTTNRIYISNISIKYSMNKELFPKMEVNLKTEERYTQQRKTHEFFIYEFLIVSFIYVIAYCTLCIMEIR